MPPKVQKTAKDGVVTHLRIKHQKVIERYFKGNYTREQVRKEVLKLQAKHKDQNLRAMIGVIIPEVAQMRNGKSLNLNENVSIPDDYEWEITNGFVVYFWKDTRASGGFDFNNDCFFIAIAQVHTTYRLPKDMKTPELFKQKLHLNRDDEIPISLVPMIESLLKININIGGDYYYCSKNLQNATVNLSLEDGHYSTEVKTTGEMIVGIPKMAHKLVFYSKRSDKVYCYDDVGEFTLTLNQYKKINSERTKSEYTYIRAGINENLKIVYKKLMKDIELIKELSFGKIDLSKSGFLPQNEIRKSIHYATQTFQQGETFDIQEEQWIDKAHLGGLRFIKEDITLQNGYEYDINASYPSKISSPSFTFPIKRGVFSYIEEIPKIVKYGLYRCKIYETNDYDLNKLFRFNGDNIYTHFDINSARLLKLDIQLIKDDQANVLLYTSGRVNGSVYFGGLVNELNNLKMKVKEIDNTNTIIKQMMTCIYGCLSAKNKIYVSLHQPVNIEGNKNILRITPDYVAYNEVGNLFKNSFARSGCFITSSVRYDMVKHILPIRQHVYKCITDSITADIPLENYIEVSNKLGDYKPDKSNGKSCKIFKNGRKTEWID